MGRSIFSPRIVLSGVFCVFLVWLLVMVVEAYRENPRVAVGLGVIQDTVYVHQQGGQIEAELRSLRGLSTIYVLPPAPPVGFSKRLESRLASNEFLAELRRIDPALFSSDIRVVIRHGPLLGISPAPGSDIAVPPGLVDTIVSDIDHPKLALDIVEHGLPAVHYTIFKGYCVQRPSHPVIAWLQSRLPGITDPAALQPSADATNKARVSEIDELVRRVIQETATELESQAQTGAGGRTPKP
ncbi:MAG: hypothetical protein ABR915_25515 [Thermoguttaceae bacterium]|jgi:hypothetical protein